MLSALLLAFAIVQDPAAWVPARWPFTAADTLALLDGSPVNCLVLEKPQWSGPLIDAAHRRGLTVLAAVPGSEQPGTVKEAFAAGVDGLVVEGDAGPQNLEVLRATAGRFFVYLPNRASVLNNAGGPILGTGQGLWPGIHPEKEGAVKAGPTAGPWIDTNFGFLQFLRAAAPPAKVIWMANRPPEDAAFGPERYVQAWADAAMSGARWVLTLDPGFAKRLYAERLAGKDDKAVAGWKRINDVLRFYVQHRELCDLPDYARLAVLQDAASGGLLSGSFLDMIAPKHIPAVVVPTGKLLSSTLPDVSMLLNTDPAALSPEQKEKVTSVARKGATLVNGPPAWKLSMPPEGAITFDDAQVQKLDGILREINQLVGRRNMGVRLFNAPGTLSSLRATPDGRRLVLHIVNYTTYPIESITAEVLGKYKSATLLTPQGTKQLKPYDVEDGTGVEIEKIEDVAIVEFR